MRLERVSRRSTRLLGPLQGLLLDGDRSGHTDCETEPVGAIREELAVLRTIEEHHRRLGSRLTLLFLATIVVDLAEPRVILLDVVLPDMSGYEICRTVRAGDGINDP